MRLHSVTLENIRSYTRCTVEFPPGSVLLSGDIGSGKTTILLAVEFVLFGTQRGELTGGMLLRHGARNGSVTLDASIAGKRITVTRALKRTSNGVAQEAGALTIDGTLVECTAQELKARILDLLNYPASLLTKSKGLLYRYTVYTPQEEMKAILHERPDDRLDTLRKLFAIDTYKRARDNTLLLLRELKREAATLEGRIEELGTETVDEERLAADRKRLVDEREALVQRLATERQRLAELQGRLDEREKRRFEREELKKRHALKLNDAKNKQARLEDFDRQKARITEQIVEMEKHLKPADTDEERLLNEQAEHDRHARLIEEKRRAIAQRQARQEALVAQHDGVAQRIRSLDECPTCKQQVTDAHKERIAREEHAIAERAQQQLKELATLARQLAEKEGVLRKRRGETEQKLRLLDANKVKQAQLTKNRADLERLERERAEFVQQRATLIAEAGALAQQLTELPALDDDAYRQEKRRLDEARAQAERTTVRQAELAKELEYLQKEQERLARRRKERRKAEKELHAKRRRIDWLGTQFIGTAHAVEKALFMSIYGLFNEYFRDWFAMLIEDETLTVRLDHEFTPVIVQNGYETGLENLSGGERTSVALAYRLALNKVINEFLDTIRTRGLLVLDEPTDGFSTEQLDRVREVLDRLALEQVIIVSHEPQMEGYVDHVIRVEKRDHESVVH